MPEPQDIAALRETAEAAIAAWGDGWIAEDVGYSEMRGLTYEVKDGSGAWVASAGCEELANHIAATSPDVVLALLSEAERLREQVAERDDYVRLVVTHLAVEGRIDSGCGRTVVDALLAAHIPSPLLDGGAGEGDR